MKNICIILLCLVGAISSQEKQSSSAWQTYTSRGLFDHRSGLTIYSVSATKNIRDNSEFFASAGTIGFINSIASGVRLIKSVRGHIMIERILLPRRELWLSLIVSLL